jgi:hypothetical protein
MTTTTTHSMTAQTVSPWEEVVAREAERLPIHLREPFVRLVQTGEASPDFLALVDDHPELQRAADAVFAVAEREFAPVVHALHAQPEQLPTVTDRSGLETGPLDAHAAAATLAGLVEQLARLQWGTRKTILQETGARLKHESSPDERSQVRQVIDGLRAALT